MRSAAGGLTKGWLTSGAPAHLESAIPDGWEPQQYDRFRSERTAPFNDLLQLVRPAPGGSAVDLGCGTGDLTVVLHEHLGAASTVGIDSSSEMLARAERLDVGGVRFCAGDIASFAPVTAYDVVMGNASLQWVPDHEHVLARWTGALRPGGQLAVQVPANADHPSHLVSAALAESEEFAHAFDGDPPPDPVLSVLSPERYAVCLEHLGFEDQHVRLQVYGHRLTSSAEVVEWVKGTSLTRFRRALSDEMYERFLERYRSRLLEALGDRRPYFYPFKRILLWGRLPRGGSNAEAS